MLLTYGVQAFKLGGRKGLDISAFCCHAATAAAGTADAGRLLSVAARTPAHIMIIKAYAA